MGLDTVSAVLIAIAFLMPGFILSSVLGMFFRRRSRSATETTLQYLTFSCVNHGLWSWLIVIMLYGDWLNQRPIVTGGLVFVILFVSPICLGIAGAWLTRRERVRALLSAVGFRVQRFIPTAWDFKFEQEQLAWVVVRLRDGSNVYGFLGTESFAGDEPSERDLYLEAVFEPSEHGHWQPAPSTRGILIKAGEIAAIEFRDLDSAPAPAPARRASEGTSQ